MGKIERAMALAAEEAMTVVFALALALISCDAAQGDAPGVQAVVKNAAKTPAMPIAAASEPSTATAHLTLPQGRTIDTRTWAPEDKRGAEDKAKDFVEDLGGEVELAMVWVEGRTFKMGSPEAEKGRGSDEGPLTDVTAASFWVGKTEVTQEQYEKVMGTNRSYFKGAKNPVEQVLWSDATEFCGKLSSKTGRTYVLPTEAQWEYACRAGSAGRFCFGDLDSGLGNYAWIDSNSGKKPHAVGQKTPNALGLYDMHGNVYEWCSSQYKPYPYREGDGRNNQTDLALRVLRGGSWGSSPLEARSAYRTTDDPRIRDFYVGFRVVRLPKNGDE